jgi:hypothetical protein
LQPLISAAQAVFSDVAADRGQMLARVRQTWSTRAATKLKLCVVAPSRFRLWNDAGQILIDLLSSTNCEIVRVDPDNPATSSPVALALAAAECDAVVTANITRADVPGATADQMPWITWLTDNRAAAASSNEKLLHASWPTIELPAQKPEFFAVIADTCSTAVPDDLVEFSSHVVLWEQIEHELLNEPLKLVSDVDTYLDHRARRLEIAPQTLDRKRFVHQLILPAYQQGLSRLLMKNSLPLKWHGRGWDRLPEFATGACGPVTSRQQLREILEAPIALVDVTPATIPHPVRSIAAPLLRPATSASESLRQARIVLTGKLQPPLPSHPPLTAEMIRSLCRG